jgi:hypothetical protein
MKEKLLPLAKANEFELTNTHREVREKVSVAAC